MGWKRSGNIESRDAIYREARMRIDLAFGYAGTRRDD